MLFLNAKRNVRWMEPSMDKRESSSIRGQSKPRKKEVVDIEAKFRGVRMTREICLD